MRQLHDIVKDGFQPTVGSVPHDFALQSARLAMRAYASTPHTLHGRLHLAKPANDANEQTIRDYNLPLQYHDAAFESIVHFQHFAELVIKNALRSDHELLVSLTEKNHVILSQLLHGEEIPPEQRASLHDVEASVALERACALLERGRLAADCAYIRDARQFLERLNGLRNRLWHRGSFILRYRALDEVIGRYALPFLYASVTRPQYGGIGGRWKHPDLHCGIDPFALIRQDMVRDDWSLAKVSFLKELARAAYENPILPDLDFFARDNEVTRRRALLLANDGAQKASVYRVTLCPVCGTHSLVIYVEQDGDSPPYTYNARCECCSLELHSSYGNASEHGLTGIEDYWAEV